MGLLESCRPHLPLPCSPQGSATNVCSVMQRDFIPGSQCYGQEHPTKRRPPPPNAWAVQLHSRPAPGKHPQACSGLTGHLDDGQRGLLRTEVSLVFLSFRNKCCCQYPAWESRMPKQPANETSLQGTVTVRNPSCCLEASEACFCPHFLCVPQGREDLDTHIVPLISKKH